MFLALFFFSLFFGRAFCAWLCPAGGLQEICQLVNDKPIRSSKINLLKYIIWVPWILGIILSFISAGGIHNFDFFYMTEHGISAASIPGFIIYYGIITLITILALTLGKRGMCHSICWMAPFMILGTKLKSTLPIPSLRLKPTPQNCVNCKQCSKKCPMSLEVHTMVLQNNMSNNECILCGECADICNKKAIHLTISK
jgi:Polyferredoxin